MQTRNRNTFSTIHTEGALLPVDLLQRISENDKNLEGLNPESYHLSPGEKLNEAINRSWNRLSGLWGSFQVARGRLDSTDAGTTLTRERWLLPLFQELGFGRLSTSKAVEIEGKSYPISHRWQNVPLHLVGCGIELDKRTPGAAGAARTSPHSLMQEYLNRSDDVQWGVISNGLGLRILRDNATLTRQAYIEFDLESMFDGELYSDFVLLWLICHQSRFETTEKQTECLLEKWSKSAQESGTRALDDLRRGVEEAIVSFGQGFLQHPLNGELRNRLKNGDLSAQDYYRQLLRLVYRLIFLFAAEDRDLLLLPGAAVEAQQRFLNYYSTTRLRALAQRQRGSRHHDRYEALRLVMTLLGSDSGCPELAIPALGGFLFDARSTADLNEAKLDNQALLSSVRSLAFITEGNTRRAVDYRNLGPEELGSVYESLLELHPLLNTDAGTFQLTSAAGNERKTTGSYYTPSSLIQVLLDSALDPVIEDRLKGKQDAAQQEQALLELKVCDPACGSGHFLIAAAHRIAGKLAEVRAGDNEPSPNETRRALRDVIRHCIYGVDINPMAVELCKVNLWLESLEPGKPLSFLDAHIKCGNSLVGVGPKMDLDELEVPDEAFNPVPGDHPATATLLKKRNKQEREGQESLFVTVVRTREDLDKWLTERTRTVEAMPEDSAADVQAKAEAYQKVNASNEFRMQRQIADLWTAAFFWKIEEPIGRSLEIVAPTHGQLRRLRNGSQTQNGLLEQIEIIHQSEVFFHWPLEFAEVASQGGFDCILGNPPWDMVELSEKEYFENIAPEIAHAPTNRKREILISNLKIQNPQLYSEFSAAKRSVYAKRKFIQACSRFPLSSEGRINLYPIFVELIPYLLNINGKGGEIVPSAISMDAYNANLFGWLIKNQYVDSLYDFENKLGIFPGIHRMYRFCLLTISKQNKQNKKIDFCYLCRDIRDIQDLRKKVSLLASEIRVFSPNTYAPPIFLNYVDAKLSSRIYKETGILLDEETKENPWMISIQRMLSLSDPGDFFRKHDELDSTEIQSEGWARLYCGKAIHQYNHRYSNYSNGEWEEVTEKLLKTISFVIETEYYARSIEVRKRLESKPTNKWLLCYRDITNATNERTVISTILPIVGCDTTCRNIYIYYEDKLSVSLFLANINSIVFDYFARQKIIGTHLNASVFEQLPVIKPHKYEKSDFSFIVPRVLELIFTSSDLTSFAEDMGYLGEPFRWDEERRALLRSELDAYYAKLYRLNRDELRYILDPQDVYGPDFPGETFRVLKDKEIRQYGEYRTRRLVLEAWDRLEGVEVGNPDGHSAQSAAVSTRQETIIVAQPRSESRPAVIQTQLPASAKPNSPVTPPAKVVKEIDPPADQPTLTDFGLYKCEVCGKMVMGFEKGNHEQEKHGGKSVDWKKVR